MFYVCLTEACSIYLPSTVPDKPTQKRRFAEGQSVEGAPLTSPPYYPYGSDPPAASSPSCEVVPVICHVRTAGHNKCQPQTQNQNRSSEHAGPSKQTSPGLANASLLEQFLESAQSKQDKLLAVLSEGSLNELPGVVAEGAVGQFSSDSGELRPEDARQATAVLRTVSADLPSETECSQTSSHSCPHFNRCDSNGDSIQSFELFDPGKGEHLADTLSDTLPNNGLYSTTSRDILKDGSHLHSRPSAETCSDAPAPLCLGGSSRTDSIAMGCQRRPSDPDLWHEIHEAYAPKSMFEGRPLDMPTAERVADEEEPKRTDAFPQTGKDYVHAYQGQLHYQYTLDPRHPRPDSSDSDSDRAFPAPSAEAKDGSMVLETIDITEISLSARLPPRERSSTHPFQCSMCERAFSQRGSLNRHMRSHLGVRPYSCPRCSMTFSRQYRVTEHMRVHQRSCEGPPQGHLRPAAAGVDV
ncbi:hypothetical protein NFI96_009105 [Prochilodus magdalenae]|nr:hypothetical protein NFI96_009105 [Prochilodus magdalenae]